ncbi:adenosylmethionine--8-amino-7-oxononanoate transaminase [Emcibacter sp. SYSU 3D8]|uniref:adenosylmethionine--8-amino-7-oxononanoate transaminase n=1 Tax=Emcibacter sp. SYSU 3D8 TaxID=3133969 RepID=UPI0031FE7241
MNPTTPLLPNTAPEWLRDGYQHIWMPYTQMQTTPPPIPVTRTDGVRITLADGRELIDGTASWWTACHGYNHPHIVAAMQKQVAEMPHVMFGGLAHEPAFRLASRLAALAPGDLNRVFFAEGGSVAVEVAMKMALQYFINRDQPERSKFVSFNGGYHGDTFAAMSVCDPEDGMHALFRDAMPQNYIAELPRTPAQREAFDLFMDENAHHIAAIMVEPLVQGAGGMKFHDAAVLRCLREACDRTGALLIFDEIFTGFGRTGALFAAETAGVVPDIMCIGKALTGGTTPLSAAIARDHVFEAFLGDDPGAALMHGPTFMANPLACAAANAALDLFEQEPWQDNVARIEAQMRRELEPCRALPGVVDVRVMGAVAAVQLDDMSDKETLKARFMDEGVWLRPLGDIVYLTPPFTIGADDLRRLTDAVVGVLSARD